MKTRLVATIGVVALLVATVAALALFSPAGIGADNTRAAVSSAPSEENDGNSEQKVPAGTIDDGEELLPQAKVTLEEAIATARTAASGKIGEIDLEHVDGRLVFNIDVGDKDVKVDATTGDLVRVDSDD